MTPPEHEWQVRARAMVVDLVAAGRLPDERWRAAFAEVPRHEFVPGVPLRSAYRDAIVTQRRALVGSTHPGEVPPQWPTSSLSAPEAVAVPLDRLDVQAGHRVLEIGTGTGYVAALLSHRLGDSHVFSLDIDPELVSTAERRLEAQGRRPHLTAGDGYRGWREHAPFDRILATCSITHIPPEWIRQLAPGGRIVAPLDGDLCAPYLIVDKTASDEVTGRFDHEGGGFMPLRPALASPLGDGHFVASTYGGMAHYGTTSLDPLGVLHADPGRGLFYRLHLPGLSTMRASTSDGPAEVDSVVVRVAGAEAAISAAPSAAGRWAVTQRGFFRLWDTVEIADALWNTLDAPSVDRFGISALDDADHQYVWLDDPLGTYSWPLRALRPEPGD